MLLIISHPQLQGDEGLNEGLEGASLQPQLCHPEPKAWGFDSTVSKNPSILTLGNRDLERDCDQLSADDVYPSPPATLASQWGAPPISPWAAAVRRTGTWEHQKPWLLPLWAYLFVLRWPRPLGPSQLSKTSSLRNPEWP